MLKKKKKKFKVEKRLPFVIVRTYSAGVHCGLLKARDGKEVELTNARRIWRWKGANSLSELSLRGADREWTRISEGVDSIILTEAIEIIECTALAKQNLMDSRWGA